jgi:hypothetical protein
MAVKKGLELVSSSTPEIMRKLDAEIAKLKAIETTPWRTNGTLIEPFKNPIKEEKLIENLIRMGSSVKERERAYNDYAIKDLGLKTFKSFDINGLHAEDFTADIQLQMAILEQKDTLEKLKSYKERMSKFLSEADQKAELLAELDEFLNR